MVAPHDFGIRLRDAIFFFDNTYAPSLAVVRKLGPVRSRIDCDQLISGIPLEGAGPVGGQIPIRVVGKCSCRPETVHLILLRGRIPARIRGAEGNDGATGAVARNVWSDAVAARTPWTVTVAGSLTVPANWRLPPGYWVTSRFRLSWVALVTVSSICSAVRLPAGS